MIASDASIQRKPGLKRKPEMPLSILADLPLIVPSRPDAILELVCEGLGFAVLPPYTLSSFQKPHTFSTHKLHSPQLECQLMLVTSARRPSTETHKGVQALVVDVVRRAIEGYS